MIGRLHEDERPAYRQAGQRSAILYTLLESCKRHGINPQEYLCDVLSRLPSMTNQQTRSNPS